VRCQWWPRIAAAAGIYAENEREASTRYHPLLGETFDPDETARAALNDLLLLYEEDPRQVWIAEDEVRGVIGFAAAAIRGHHWHLTYLFVTPEVRQQGVGAALLQGIHEAGREAGCRVFSLQASDDPRALTRYLRLGLVPQPSSINWSASRPVFPPSDPASRLQAIVIRLDDEAVLNTVDDVDKAVRGMRRRADIVRWLRQGATGALLIDRENGIPVGYFLVSVDKDSGRIGPVASLDASRFREVLSLSLVAAADLHRSGVTWGVISPGENRAAIEPLLGAGFRPRYCDVFFASAPIGRWESYLFHDVDLL
jgi:GNAT superfamily N-acetyltransferase